MNKFKFFIFQVLLSIIGISINVLYQYINELSYNKFITALIKAPISGLIIYLSINLYFSLKTELLDKILIHIGAFIVGVLIVGLTGSFMNL